MTPETRISELDALVEHRKDIERLLSANAESGTRS
jgi:hypothetical protein